MKHRELKVAKTYAVRLEKDEDVMESLAAFCGAQNITHASFRAIGAIKDAKVGYYDLAEKKYGTIEYPHEMEVASMLGNVALVDDKPFVHAHVVLSDMQQGKENQCVGGHLFSAKVAVTLEVHLESYDATVAREMDHEIGLKLLDL
ncbi:MAG: hypothetical protein RIQ56_140 [Candidatus Parcubacteria bacterium]|jgi:predicted DNA-binding protein with PD1-like motif